MVAVVFRSSLVYGVAMLYFDAMWCIVKSKEKEMPPRISFYMVLSIVVLFAYGFADGDPEGDGVAEGSGVTEGSGVGVSSGGTSPLAISNSW